MKHIVPKLVIGVMLTMSLPALADHRDDYGRRKHGHWEDHEIHRFGQHDLKIWRGGHWHHGRHDGHMGWWWIAAGIWYFYPGPVYPYPDPYTPPVTIINQQPPVVVIQPDAPLPPQPAAQHWYYCGSAKNYYPYVPSCPEGWKAVPVQPPQSAPQ